MTSDIIVWTIWACGMIGVLWWAGLLEIGV